MAEPLSKLAEKCKSCPKSEKCDHKRMELCALADLLLNIPHLKMLAKEYINICAVVINANIRSRKAFCEDDICT